MEKNSKHTEEAIKKMSYKHRLWHQNNIHPVFKKGHTLINGGNKGKKMSEYSKKLMSEKALEQIKNGTRKGAFTKGHPNYSSYRFEKGHKIRVGMKHSEETRKLMSEHNGMKKEENRIKVGKILKQKYASGELKPSKSCFPKLENHPCWEGGKSFEPYGLEFNKRLKKEIKNRDNGCMLCNIGFEDLKLLKRRVHIHHINYDKSLNIPENLISLCQSCHNKTGFNRNHWINFFQNLLSEKYGYQYNLNRIILNL